MTAGAVLLLAADGGLAAALIMAAPAQAPCLAPLRLHRQPGCLLFSSPFLKLAGRIACAPCVCTAHLAGVLAGWAGSSVRPARCVASQLHRPRTWQQDLGSQGCRPRRATAAALRGRACCQYWQAPPLPVSWADLCMGLAVSGLPCWQAKGRFPRCRHHVLPHKLLLRLPQQCLPAVPQLLVCVRAWLACTYCCWLPLQPFESYSALPYAVLVLPAFAPLPAPPLVPSPCPYLLPLLVVLVKLLLLKVQLLGSRSRVPLQMGTKH